MACRGCGALALLCPALLCSPDGAGQQPGLPRTAGAVALSVRGAARREGTLKGCCWWLKQNRGSPGLELLPGVATPLCSAVGRKISKAPARHASTSSKSGIGSAVSCR